MGSKRKNVKTTAGPNRPSSPVAGAAPEPFVRLAALAARERGRAAPPASYEERTGALIRRADRPEGLEPERLDRVWARVAGGVDSPRPGHHGLPLRWAVAALVLLSAGAGAAATGSWTWPRAVVRRLMNEPARPAAPPTIGGVTGETKGPPADQTEVPAIAPPLETPPPPAAEPGRAPVSPVRRPRGEPRVTMPPATAPPVAVPQDTALAEESQSLSRALVRLRQARDATGALIELDHYASRFPSGVLAREALVARVDALLMAGRSAEARTILSRMTLGAGGRDRELRLIRAELATGTACPAALADYQAVWDAHPRSDDPWGERALWGQAVCHARLGDEARARADLTRYLALFPEGPHAAGARARLAVRP